LRRCWGSSDKCPKIITSGLLPGQLSGQNAPMAGGLSALEAAMWWSRVGRGAVSRAWGWEIAKTRKGPCMAGCGRISCELIGVLHTAPYRPPPSRCRPHLCFAPPTALAASGSQAWPSSWASGASCRPCRCAYPSTVHHVTVADSYPQWVGLTPASAAMALA
jgi:hypothetical protein